MLRSFAFLRVFLNSLRPADWPNAKLSCTWWRSVFHSRLNDFRVRIWLTSDVNENLRCVLQIVFDAWLWHSYKFVEFDATQNLKVWETFSRVVFKWSSESNKNVIVCNSIHNQITLKPTDTDEDINVKSSEKSAD